MDLELSGRAAIVTGASRGIGRAVALQLAAEGADVLLIGRNAQALARVREDCAARSDSRALPLELDITAPDAGEQAVNACRQQLGRLDILVNNAGTSATRPLDELTDDEWQEQWELHVMAPMRLMRAGAPVMAERQWGRIVNVSSSAGKRPSQRNVAYAVTKAATLSLSRAYADAYAKRGVLVNAVTPGPVGSELWMAPGGLADQAAEAQGSTREEVLEKTAAGVPLGRFGTEEEIASVIAFLCSARASFVTGAAWSADGGAVPIII
jgi:3-oxoacyl-[acyl-carrier protein] reductase